MAMNVAERASIAPPVIRSAPHSGVSADEPAFISNSRHSLDPAPVWHELPKEDDRSSIASVNALEAAAHTSAKPRPPMSDPPFPPNEPQRYYDVGNFYSTHYLSPQKIIGVNYHGGIFLSNDSGRTWVQRPSGVTADLYGVHFFGMAHGIAVGAQGTILMTADSGWTWRPVPSGTTATLSTVRFVSQDTVYICGDAGVMLRSTTGGSAWKLLATGVVGNLFRMAFQNGAIGDVFGANGVHIATTDGGQTWNTIK